MKLDALEDPTDDGQIVAAVVAEKGGDSGLIGVGALGPLPIVVVCTNLRHLGATLNKGPKRRR